MHWEILIIPLIAVGVWILGTLFRSEDEKAKKGIGRRPFSPLQGGKGTGGGRTPGRRLVTDLDRFLEEARRRRESEEQRQAPPPVRVPAARPALRPRSTPPQQTPRPAAPSSALPKTRRTRSEESAAVLPAPPPPLVSPPVAGSSPAFSPSKPEEGKVGMSLVREAPPSPSSAIPSAPLAQQVRSLLSKPQTAAIAFVLREIFDRPLCKRRC